MVKSQRWTYLKFAIFPGLEHHFVFIVLLAGFLRGRLEVEANDVAEGGAHGFLRAAAVSGLRRYGKYLLGVVEGEDGNAVHEAEDSAGEGAAEDEGSLVEGGWFVGVCGNAAERGLLDVHG